MRAPLLPAVALLGLLALTSAGAARAAAQGAPGPSASPSATQGAPHPMAAPAAVGADVPEAARAAEALWVGGQRLAALDALAAQVAAHPEDHALALHAAHRQEDAGRWEAALATLAGLGPEADHLRATALYILTRYEEALPLLDAGDPAQCLLRIDALLALGRVPDAEAALAGAAAVRGADDEALCALRGRLLAAQGRFAEAVPQFRAAVARDPLDRAALFGLGQALLRTGAREEGLALLEKHRALLPLLDRHDFQLQALELDPLHADNHAQLGDTERELALIDNAELRYRRAEELAEPAELVPIVLRHARLLDENRHAPQAAVELLDAAAALVPDPRLGVRSADILLRAGRAPEAVTRLEKLLATRPADRQLQLRLAAAREAAARGAPATAPDASPAASPAQPAPPAQAGQAGDGR